MQAVLAYCAGLGVRVLRVMTDNGSCYRSEAFAKTCRRLELEHLRTRPYTPRTNGQAERFMGLCLAPYPTTTSARQRCRPGSTATTGIVRMAV